MKKQAAALALSMLFLFLCFPVKAAESVYFTAAGSYMLPLADHTMPFWTGGYLYIPSTIFTGAGREALDVSQVLNNAKNRLVLYSSGRSLTFDLTANFASDDDGNTYYPGAVRRSGTVFVPAYVVTRYFDLTYSVIEVERGSLVWLRPQSYTLSDKLYADAAQYSMESVYAAYLRAKEDALQPETPSPVLPSGPTASDPYIPPAVTPAPQPDPEDPEELTLAGRRVNLCIEANASTEALLDVLEARGVQATFFAPAEFLAQEENLLRRMAASGQHIGILADGKDPEYSVPEQLAAGNRSLYFATCGMTRLVYVQNASAQNLLETEAEGCRNLTPHFSRDGLQTASAAGQLLRRAAARSGDSTVWLSGLTASGLRSFLDAVEEAGGQCGGWTEIT